MRAAVGADGGAELLQCRVLGLFGFAEAIQGCIRNVPSALRMLFVYHSSLEELTLYEVAKYFLLCRNNRSKYLPSVSLQYLW